MKERLDILLVKRGLFESREKAKAVIIAGLVTVDGKLVDKPDSKFSEDALIELKSSLPYVSKGGFKLKKALDEFSLDVKDFIVMDIGASTGGFTDCLLQEGARKVYAVDVGKGLLHEKLRKDKRVILMERINARYLKEEDIPEKLDLITIDVSFISILKIFPRLKPLLKKEGKVLSLIKPQFEAGSKDVSRGGIVKKDDVHLRVIENIRENTKNLGFFLENITYYISKEGKGNIEYPALFSQIDCGDILIEPVVEEAFKNWDLVLKK
ncbi:MAG TPA: TlyA family RNA methyltransferase [Dictyoglomaceae bacterium]|nr:TlyA family RNA methyltransferase [Dictyoglomaceae bacterium]HOL38773.1 TlyA family RNA methyltransferase [Dictyoglomaceae bacterium]HOP94523.1 TlyA family RNA methyltransferase [Dictyoglomaceae bacterium]HPP15478.1 TlyA family RNA methyltransferase [Dictyoglomaceae bacterium]HPU43113.1 TlyA family RNA methyltransferase [Dictyoglomaceae bacterium]